ncbi:MAG: YgfZ/GcvT domain-containing protein [Microcoleaceae cyanobacterium]
MKNLQVKNLQELQASAGAIFDQNSGIPISFGNDPLAMQAVQSGVTVCDRSHGGLLQISGEDRLRFLHNQSTNAIQTLKPGQGCDTVFVTSTARTLDLATVYVTETALLILVSQSRRQQLLKLLDKYIFPMDRIELKDVSQAYVVFNLIGSNSIQLLEKLGINLEEKSYGSHQTVIVENIPIRVATGNGLAIDGYTIILEVEKAGIFWEILTTQGAIPLGENVWENLRIQQGRPMPDLELTEDYNPLEAGLWHTISFDKGCYIGQETIARLNTYKGVKQRLFGIQLTAPVSPGTVIRVGDEKVGMLTSYTEIDQRHFGLGYIRTKAGGVGLSVDVGDVSGEVVKVPYLNHPLE